jgi:hypothetical protein
MGTEDFGISDIVLVALDGRLDELRSHQQYGVPERLKLAPPVMSTAAGLNTDQARHKQWDGRPPL